MIKCKGSVVFVGALILVGCNFKKSDENVVIKIDKATISRPEVNKVAEVLRQGLIQLYPERAVEGLTPELLKSAGQQLIANHVLLKEAARRGITIDSLQVNSAFEKMAAQYQNVTVFQQQIAAMGETETSVRKRISEGLLLDSLLKTILDTTQTIGDEECLQFFNQNKQQMVSPPRMRASQVAFMFDSTGSQESKDRALMIANKAIIQIRNGKTIDAIIKEYQSGSVVVNGGDVGWFKKGDLRPDLENVIIPLALNQVSDVVSSDKAYHLLLKTGEEGGRDAIFSEVQEQIRSTIAFKKRNDRVASYIDSLVALSNVKYLDTLFIPAPTARNIKQ